MKKSSIIILVLSMIFIAAFVISTSAVTDITDTQITTDSMNVTSMNISDIFFVPAGNFNYFKAIVEGGTNRKVIVPPGEYSFTSTVTPLSGTSIICSGGRNSVFKANNSLDDEMLDMEDKSFFVMEGCFIDGNAAGQSIEKEGAFRFNNVTNISIRNNYFENFNGDILRVWGGGYGVSDQKKESDVKILHNIFHNTVDLGNYGKCLGIANGYDFLVDGNSFENCARQAIHVGEVWGGIVTNNIAKDSGDECIFVNYDSADIMVNDNWCNNGADEGGIVIARCNDCSVSNNHINGTNRGIVLLNNATRTLITENRLTNIRREGITTGVGWGSQNITDIVVTNNYITNPGIGTNRRGINLDNITGVVRVIGNTIDDELDNMLEGIFASAPNSEIRANFISGGKSEGIRTTGNNATIVDNIIDDVFNFGSSRFAIGASGDDTYVSGNKIINQEKGINLTGDGNYIINNRIETSGDVFSGLNLSKDISTGNIRQGRVVNQSIIGNDEIRLSTAGEALYSNILHSDNSNGNSHAQQFIQTGGGSGGDPKTIWEISGQAAYACGIDNTEGDRFTCGGSSTIGTNNFLRVDSNGLGLGPFGGISGNPTDLEINFTTTHAVNISFPNGAVIGDNGSCLLGWSPGGTLTQLACD